MIDPSSSRYVEGPYGNAHRLAQPDEPEFAETVCWWLVTAPEYHPVWSQYYMAVVRLRDDIPGFPQPYHAFLGSTHELVVLALQPSEPPLTPADLDGFAHNGQLPYLVPVNIHEQFEATDEEMEQVAFYAAWGITHGTLNPETGDAPTAIREWWLTACLKTLAHIRGEAHAS